jgi:CO/xanthine dehydrogenase Mo-binding subunit
VHQGYIEPYACSVEIDAEGRILAWASTQSPFSARDQMARLLDLPKDRVILHPIVVGGSFGGKDHLIDIPIAYYLARAAGKPVRIVRTYGEELLASAPRHPAIIFLRSGVKRDGRLWARDARVIYNGGAYGAFKPSPPAHMSGALTQGGAYQVPHTRLESLCVYTNQVPGGYMRASGELQTVFAAETHMDMIAAELGIDPLEFRFLNALSEGDANYSGFQYRDIKCREVLERARAAWTQPKLAPLKPDNSVGRGIALSCRHVGQGESEAEILLGTDRQRATGGRDYRPGSRRARDAKASRRRDPRYQARTGHCRSSGHEPRAVSRRHQRTGRDPCHRPGRVTRHPGAD